MTTNAEADVLGLEDLAHPALAKQRDGSIRRTVERIIGGDSSRGSSGH